MQIRFDNTSSSSSSSGSISSGGSSNIIYAPPNIAIYRWLVLFVSCTITIGNYFCFDIPSVLYEPLAEHFNYIDYFEVEFNMLYIVYSLPNVVLPLFGGFLIDKWGQGRMILSFSLLVFCGQLVIAFGCSIKSFSVILLGRFLFGIGGESLMVSIVSLLSSWFEGKELAFALGLMLSLSRLGSAANDWVSPVIEASKGVTVVFWFGAFLCLLSVFATIAVVLVDYNFKSKFEVIQFGQQLQEDDFNGEWENSDQKRTKTLGLSPSSSPSITSTELMTARNTQANALIGKMFSDDEFAEGESGVMVSVISSHVSIEVPSDNTGDEETGRLLPSSPPPQADRTYFTLSDLQAHRKNLWPPSHNPSVWMVFASTFLVYGAIIPFINLANEILRIAYFNSAAEHNADYMEYVIPR